MTDVARAGTAFLVSFVSAIVLSGEVIGSFADPDRQFVAVYSDPGARVAQIGGAFLLLTASASFAWFSHLFSRDAGRFRAPLLITGAVAAGGMVIAALAWATVPLSMAFGTLVGDPGFESGHAVLAQFGWVAFGLGAMLPAGAFIVIAARTPGLLPRWLVGASYPIAVLVVLTAFFFLTGLLFVLWVAAAMTTRGRPTL